MNKSICAILVCLVLIEQFQHSHANIYLENSKLLLGFKWQPLNAGDAIPGNAIPVSDYNEGEMKKFVGRTEYLNSVKLAEVYNSTYGIIVSYSETIVRTTEFEVLVAEDCQWITFDKNDIPPQNLVLGGRAWNAEPIYVGRAFSDPDSDSWEIASIYLTSKKIETFSNSRRLNALTCNENHSWVDAKSSVIPAKSIFVDNFYEGAGYIARLLGPLGYIPSVAIPSANTTVAKYENIILTSFLSQVLVEDLNTYSWKYTNKIIPDYAVACGITENNELMYITKDSNRVTYWFYSDFRKFVSDVPILVRNV